MDIYNHSNYEAAKHYLGIAQDFLLTWYGHHIYSREIKKFKESYQGKTKERAFHCDCRGRHHNV